MHQPFPLYFETFGSKQNPCIILIMGLGGQLINWQKKFINKMVENEFYVIAFDNRDVGLSRSYDEIPEPDLMSAINDKQEGRSFKPPYTLNDMAADVILLMDHLHIEKAHLVGISMGGVIGQIFALDYPDRVLSLVLIATTSGDPTLPPAKPEILEFFFSPQRKSEDMESYLDNKIKLYKIYNPCEHVDDNQARDFYKKVYQRGYNPAGFKRQLLAMIAGESRVEPLKKLTTPTFIIHGDHDPVFPLEHGQQLATVIPHAKLAIIKNMGHGLPESISELAAEKIIKFLKN